MHHSAREQGCQEIIGVDSFSPILRVRNDPVRSTRISPSRSADTFPFASQTLCYTADTALSAVVCPRRDVVHHPLPYTRHTCWSSKTIWTLAQNCRSRPVHMTQRGARSDAGGHHFTHRNCLPHREIVRCTVLATISETIQGESLSCRLAECINNDAINEVVGG